MGGVTATLNIVKTTLITSQLALEVASNNVSNANTEGYSKQVLNISALDSISISAGQIGTGVIGEEINRQYDALINQQVVDKNSEYEYWSSQSTILSSVETIFDEGDDYGMNYLLSEFYSAWSDLSNTPDGLAERESLLGKAEDLIQTIYYIDSDLRDTQANINSNIEVAVETINAITAQIADLNQQITQTEGGDKVDTANSLRDQRDELLLELSGYLDINYYEDEGTGQLNVYILGGTPLVQSTSNYELTAERNSETGNTDVIWNGSSGATVNVTNKLESGKIAGWVAVRDNIDSYLESLNTFAHELAFQVNDLHSLGTGLETVSSMTGTEVITDTTLALDGTDADGEYYYEFGEYFSAGSFDIVVYDDNGDYVNTGTVTLAAGATVDDLLTAVTAITNMSATVDADGHLNFSTTTSGYTFAFSANSTDDSNHALAVLGMNTFFSWTSSAGELTETISINENLTNNTDLIAAGSLSSDNEIAVGDNTTALAITELQDTVLDIQGRNTTIEGYYSSFIAQLGVDIQQAETNETYYSNLLQEYTDKKDSISGVNLDEEMIDLLRFQQMYQAAAKVITTADDMMQTLLSMKQ